jgi:putative FmdB family regulatory protein
MQELRQNARKKRALRAERQKMAGSGAFYASPSLDVQRRIGAKAFGSRAPRLPSRGTGAFICGVVMPTYEYTCEKCGHEFDFFQSIKDKPLTTCPEEKCGLKKWGKGKVKKMIGSGAGIIFKGSGFYITDYRSESYKEAAKKDTAPASDSGPKSAESKGKSESAPKAESKPKESKTSKPDKS